MRNAISEQNKNTNKGKESLKRKSKEISELQSTNNRSENFSTEIQRKT
jgi:hypothetical protein